MSPKFDFYITFRSMCVVFVTSLFCTVSSRWAVSGLLHIGYIVWGGATNWVYIGMRAIVVLCIAIVPFRSHLDEHPILIWVVLGVSFVATSLPWVITQEIDFLMWIVIGLMHVFAYVGWFVLIFEDGVLAERYRNFVP